MGKSSSNRKNLYGALLLFLIVGAGLVIFYGRAPEPLPEPGSVSAEQYGDEWAFTVDSGVIGCVMPGNHVVMDASDGNRYAINGSARGTGEFNDLELIWKDTPDGFPVDVTPFIQIGLAQCG